MLWPRKKSGRKSKSKSRIVKKNSFFHRENFLFLLKRFSVFLFIAVVIGWLSAWFYLSDASEKTGQWLQEKAYSISANMGFTIDNLIVEGRNYADPQSIKNSIDLEKGAPIFALQKEKVYDTLLKQSWIKDVSIKRYLPNTVVIRIEENVPMALWQHEGTLSLVDSQGDIITSDNLNEFKDLIILSGGNAPKNAHEFLSNLRAEPEIYNNVDTAKFVSNRRWDLILKNNILIKLGEGNIALALSTLSKIHTEDNIFNKNIESIDLRDLSKISIKTKLGEEYETSRGSNKGNVI